MKIKITTAKKDDPIYKEGITFSNFHRFTLHKEKNKILRRAASEVSLTKERLKDER